MTDTRLIIAVAKLDEWKPDDRFEQNCLWWHPKHIVARRTDELLPYLTSRDAIIPVIEKCIIDDDIQTKFNYALYDQLPRQVSEKYAYTFVVVVKATARQLSIALVKATGNWTEE